MYSKLAILSLFALEAHAFWRMPCRQSLVVDRVDPIMNFGTVADHVHTIHGGNKFSKSATGEDLLKSDCTSCQVKQDKSAYWTPQLYFHDEAGNFNAVNQTGGMLVYYLLRGENVTAFPPGFRMLAGDPTLRNFPWPNVEMSLWTEKDKTEAAYRQKAVGYNCLNYDSPAEAALGLNSIPQDRVCKDGLRAEVFFPSCWNGKDLDSPDHRDHMRYPSAIWDGDCPEGFPIRLVSLFYETIWNVYAFNGQKGEFVFSNGDPTGYGYHGDFINAWEDGVLQKAVDTCTSPSGVIEECSVFDLASLDEMHQCTIPREIVEDVYGPLTKLPGCNAISRGPDPAPEGCETPGNTDDSSGSTDDSKSDDSKSDDSKSTSSTTSETKETSKTTSTPTSTKEAEASSTETPARGNLDFSFEGGGYGGAYNSDDKVDVGVMENQGAPGAATTTSDPYLVIVTVTQYTTLPPTTLTAATVTVEETAQAAPYRRHLHRRHGHAHRR